MPLFQLLRCMVMMKDAQKQEKLDVLDLIISTMMEREKELDRLMSRMETLLHFYEPLEPKKT